MKNKDTNSLSSLYESKVVTKNVLNEEVPPVSELEGLNPEKYAQIGDIAQDVSQVGAFRAERGSYKGVPRLPADVTRDAIYSAGIRILRKLREYPNGTFPGTVEEFKRDVVIDLMKETFPPNFFRPSWYQYLAGQTITALLKVRAIQKTGEGTRAGRQPRDLEAAIRNLVIEIPGGVPGQAQGEGQPPRI